MCNLSEPQTGEQLPQGGVLRQRYIKRPGWQIWLTDTGSALCVSPQLHESWLDAGFVEPGVFLPLPCGMLTAEAALPDMISASAEGPYPQSGSQAMAIVQAFARSREEWKSTPLGLCFYLPQLPHLLPLAGGEGPDRDAWVLGRWLSGGVNVPFTDGQRMRAWTPGLTESMYLDLLALFDWQETSPEKIREAPQPKDMPAVTPTKRALPARQGAFSLPGRPKLEAFFRERIIDVIDREEAYRKMGISFPGPTLLSGPPGCGKTYAVEKLTEYLGWPSFSVNASSIGSSYIHETSRLISQLFQQVMDSAPSIVIMDEMEAFLSSRSDLYGSQQYHVEEMAEFLRILPELPKHRVLLFGMTNMPQKIDQAITRKGRFDHLLTVDMPSEEELKALLSSLLEEVPKEPDLDLGRIARRLCQRPISDAVYVAKEAGRLAVVQGKDRISRALLNQACDDLLRQGSRDSARRTIGFQ